jgi:hypothetical protein
MLYLLTYKVDIHRVKEFSAYARSRGKVEGINQLGDYETPTGTGIAIVEAQTEEALYQWFVPMRTFFSESRIEPIMDVRKVVQLTQ